jgi:ectoine hydroxylase-related dioxygenase (phytanoyl-CoA dioxygenase family)
VVALKARVDVGGFGNWTIKDGVHHAEAPQELLQKMFNLRLHLDDCDRHNGALKIVAGSHHCGKLTVHQLKAVAGLGEALFCEALTGEVVAMKALAIHASEPSAVPNHRRVLHIDFCDAPLPSQLNWALDW